MSKIIAYPGSFRPFHLGHLRNVIHFCRKYKKSSMIIAVSKTCKRSSLSATTAVRIVKLSIPDDLTSRVSVVVVSSNPVVAYKKLFQYNVSHVISGSIKTILILKILKNINVWNGKIVKLNNAGIHATKIRQLISIGSRSWKKHIAQPAVSFLEAEM